LFAEFEWNTTSDRIKAGIERAGRQGKRLGRPSTVTEATRRAIREKHRQGLGKLKIARELGCGVSTVQRVLASP